MLDLEGRTGNVVTALGDLDAYLNQQIPPAGYTADQPKPPTTLAEAFKFGLDSIGRHRGYNGGYYDNLLSAFPADPITHLT